MLPENIEDIKEGLIFEMTLKHPYVDGKITLPAVIEKIDVDNSDIYTRFTVRVFSTTLASDVKNGGFLLKECAFWRYIDETKNAPSVETIVAVDLAYKVDDTFKDKLYIHHKGLRKEFLVRTLLRTEACRNFIPYKDILSDFSGCCRKKMYESDERVSFEKVEFPICSLNCNDYEVDVMY